MRNDMPIFSKVNSFEEIIEIAKIEEHFFSDYAKKLTPEILLDWYNHNSDMFYVVKDNEGNVKGFTILTPVTEDLYEKIRSGETVELVDFNKEEVPRTLDTDFFFISDVCVLGDNPNGRSFSTASLAGNIAEIFYAKTKERGVEGKVLTVAITEDSQRLCKNHMSFIPVRGVNIAGVDGVILELLCSEENYRKFSKFSKVFGIGKKEETPKTI